MRVSFVLLSFLVTACTTTMPTKDILGIASQDDVLGEWDIIRFDDFKPKRLDYDGGRNAYVNFWEGGTSYRITCNYSGNSAVINDQGLLVIRPDGTDSAQTVMGCGQKRENRDEKFFGMMSASPKVERLRGERLRLTTDAHELILERSESRQKKNAIRKISSLYGQWNIGMIRRGGYGWGGSFYAKQPLIISETHIQYGECYPMLLDPKISEMATIFGRPKDSNAMKKDCDQLTDAEQVVLKLITSSPIAEPMIDGEILISHENINMVLTKDENW